MIISCKQIAQDCDVHSVLTSNGYRTPYTVLNIASIYDASHGIDMHYQTGLDLVIPFRFSLWEVYTYFAGILKRYYLLSHGDSSDRAHPVMVTSYYPAREVDDTEVIMDATMSIPDTSILLHGMSNWVNYYTSKNHAAFTGWNKYAVSDLSTSFDSLHVGMLQVLSTVKSATAGWTALDELMLSMAASGINNAFSYSHGYDFERINYHLDIIAHRNPIYTGEDYPSFATPVQDRDIAILLNALTPMINKIEGDETDVMLRYANAVNIESMLRATIPLSVNPVIDDLIGTFTRMAPLTFGTGDWEEIPSGLDFINKVAEYLLRMGYLEYDFIFDCEKSSIVSETAWNTMQYGASGMQTMHHLLYSWPEVTHSDSPYTKLELHLKHGVLHLILTSKAGEQKRYSYVLAIHAIAGAEVVHLPSRYQFAHY